MATGNTKHWGEFEDQQMSHDDWGMYGLDADLQIPQQTQPSPPDLFQPSQEETASFQILPQEMCCSDPLVLHTIKLLQHQRQLTQLITRAQNCGVDSHSTIPPFPEEAVIERKAAKNHYLNFLPPQQTDFTSGNKGQKLEIKSATSRLILRKAVATVCAHIGFTDTVESVLRFLTDVTHDFLTKLTSLLRSNMDNMLMSGSCPFHDVVEQTLHDIGFGGMVDLHTLYKDRVIAYHAKVKQQTLQLHHKYQSLVLREEVAATSKVMRISGDDFATRASTSSHLAFEDQQQQHHSIVPGVTEAKAIGTLEADMALHAFD